MSARRQDFELLQSYARRGEQRAFADLVRRHLDLVFATALRKVEDASAAQEVAQNVFIALSRKAWRFAPDDSLPAWLHKTTLLEAKSWLRSELRRQRREDTAAQLGTTMRTPDDQSAFQPLLPLLDEALLSLRESDRTAILLRYFENRSLRDVGTVFGVCEDAAQKRVQRSLEKLVRFFRRRGFKTVSVSATAAALTSTGSSTSAAMATAVLDAAMQAAPPAMAGVSGLLTWVAALSKVQTTLLCVALATGPVAWQWSRAKRVEGETEALHLQEHALRSQQEEAAAEVERLRAEAGQLESRRATAELAQVREQEAAQRLENLKLRARSLLAVERYRWPDDLPFVRIPKAAIRSISIAGGPNTPARLQSKISQFLELSPAEQQTVEQVFSNYYAGLDRQLAESLYETNQAVGVKLPPAAESTVFVLQPMGPKIRAATDQVCAALTAILGEERWAMVRPPEFEFTHYEQERLLGYTQFAWDQTQEIAVSLFTNGTGEATVSWSDSSGAGASPIPLRLFLQFDLPGLPQGPPALRGAVRQWAAAQAAARLPNPEH